MALKVTDQYTNEDPMRVIYCKQDTNCLCLSTEPHSYPFPQLPTCNRLILLCNKTEGSWITLTSSSLNQERLSAVSTNQYSLAPPLMMLMLLMVSQPLRMTWGERVQPRRERQKDSPRRSFMLVGNSKLVTFWSCNLSKGGETKRARRLIEVRECDSLGAAALTARCRLEALSSTRDKACVCVISVECINPNTNRTIQVRCQGITGSDYCQTCTA